jgi:hypothetical protein
MVREDTQPRKRLFLWDMRVPTTPLGARRAAKTNPNPLAAADTGEEILAIPAATHRGERHSRPPSLLFVPYTVAAISAVQFARSRHRPRNSNVSTPRPNYRTETTDDCGGAFPRCKHVLDNARSSYGDARRTHSLGPRSQAICRSAYVVLVRSRGAASSLVWGASLLSGGDSSTRKVLAPIYLYQSLCEGLGGIKAA